MPKSYKLKLILGGAKGSGKTSFINDNTENDSPIGVSFKPIECYANESDSYKFVIWDLKDRERFRFLFPLFCRGACAGLLCFDISDKNSFLDLKRWIKIFRSSAGDIPIILIGSKHDLEQKVSREEIEELIQKYHLEGIYFTSIYEDDDKKADIFKYIVEKIEPDYPIENFTLFTPKQLDTEEYKNFIKYFSRCPICKKENHSESLKNFYISKDPKVVKLREQLIYLLDNLEEINVSNIKNLSIGMPCCNCYTNIFEKNYD
ncbi:MAG: Rab family GTPase [Candidatus Hermodarchaeota archaeon]